MIVGFFKKVVIADTVAIAVNSVYNDPAQASGLGVAIATALLPFRYCAILTDIRI